MHKHEAQGSSQTKVITRDASQLRALADLIRNDGFAMSFQSMRQYRQALIRVVENSAAPPAEQQPSTDALTPVPDELFAAEFSAWWEQHGQFCRAGGGDYERTFAFEAWRHLYPKLMKLQKVAAEQQPAPDLTALVEELERSVAGFAALSGMASLDAGARNYARQKAIELNGSLAAYRQKGGEA